MILNNIKVSLKVLSALSALYIIYVFLVTALSHVFFYDKATGSLIFSGAEVIGSKLLAQDFKSPHYFHGRPSAANKTKDGIVVSSSGESKIDTATVLNTDIIMYSGSGLDPHIYLDSAFEQIPRVAKARNLNEDRIRILVQKSAVYTLYSQKRLVNVLELNIAMDNRFGKIR